jgi:hypothetical protein
VTATAERPPPDVLGVEIVLLGSFNPKIFQPAWFAAQNLLSQEVANESNVEVVTNDISSFETSWCRIQVLDSRFSVLSQTAPLPEALRDLALGTFAILSHTPIFAIGINYYEHFRVKDYETWHNFGHTLAPKDTLWKPILRNPGTQNLQIRAERDDEYKGSVNVTVQPSNMIEPGVFVQTNDEFREDQGGGSSATWVTALLETQWSEIAKRSKTIRDHLWHSATSGES